MKRNIFAYISIFSLGFITNDIMTTFNVEVITTAHADVAGMSSYDLKRDRDFKAAVKSVLEDELNDYDFSYNYNFEDAVTDVFNSELTSYDFENAVTDVLNSKLSGYDFSDNYYFDSKVKNVLNFCSISGGYLSC